MKKWRGKLWILVPVLILTCAIAAAVLIILPIVRGNDVISCTGADASNFACWQKHYGELATAKNPEAAFLDFRKEYAANPFVKANCHQLAHAIGRAAAKKYPTLTETYAHGDNFCWSGYYHGAIETIAQKLGPTKIMAQINQVCSSFFKSKPYGFDHYNCVHGMGHGLMAVQNNNLFEALQSCDLFDGQWQQESCYGGVFMENVMDEINPGEHSNYLKSNNPLYPCTAVADRYKEQCYLMQTSHALIVEGYDYGKVFALCGGLATPFDTTCYQSLGRDVSGQSSSDQATTVKLCMLGTTYQARDNCFTGAVKDFISYFHAENQGLAMCHSIPITDLATSCKTQADAYYQTL